MHGHVHVRSLRPRAEGRTGCTARCAETEEKSSDPRRIVSVADTVVEESEELEGLAMPTAIAFLLSLLLH